MKMLIYLVPVIGAASGWLIVSLAVQLLFRPVNPVRLPVLGVLVQGVLPKKRQELAAVIGEIIQTQLQLAVTGHNQAAEGLRGRLTTAVVSSVGDHLEGRIPLLIPARIRNAIVGSIEEIIRREIPRFFDTFAENVVSPDGAGGHLERAAQEKINTFDLDELFYRVNRSKELLILKSSAAFVGFASGVLQLFVVWAAVA